MNDHEAAPADGMWARHRDSGFVHECAHWTRGVRTTLERRLEPHPVAALDVGGSLDRPLGDRTTGWLPPMSWSAHQFESYVLQKHFGRTITISYLAIVVGDMIPDSFTKVWVYGFNVGGTHYGVEEPADFHRGWPGAGFTHSLLFGAVIVFGPSVVRPAPPVGGAMGGWHRDRAVGAFDHRHQRYEGNDAVLPFHDAQLQPANMGLRGASR